MFSTKAEYGVRVMVALAQRAAQSPAGEEPVVPLAEIAERDGLPLAYLEHLVARLRKAGLIDSRRGSRGGYILARAPGEITMAEVVEALEGSIAPIECISLGSDGSVVCSRESGGAGGLVGTESKVCPTKLLWTRVRFAIVSTLMETTLADLLAGVAGAAGERPVPTAQLPLAPSTPAPPPAARQSPGGGATTSSRTPKQSIASTA
ncbi:MAG TPA: Rrf2 family transcriptional regulator [Solirubrobacteraceae bacterium]|nr:Rrf2 family transcriptional regulator [Solirubrobacteraceae bacterium]